MNRSDSIAKLTEALSRAQAEIAPALKKATNDYFSSKYATLADVVEVARQALAKHGLAVFQPVSGDGESVTVETVLSHVSGEWAAESITFRPRPEPRLDRDRKPIPGTEAVTPQAMGSAITYARRYAFAAMVGVVTEDDDGAAASGTTADQPKQPVPANGNGSNRRPTGENAKAANGRFAAPKQEPAPPTPDPVQAKPEPPKPIPTAQQAEESEQAMEQHRVAVVDEIQTRLKNAYPGKDGNAVKAKGDLLELAFGTRSWTIVQNLPAQRLATGLAKIADRLAN